MNKFLITASLLALFGKATPAPAFMDADKYNYVFFNHKDTKLQFYTGTNPEDFELQLSSDIVARDPSVLKVGDTYYIATTKWSPDEKTDFRIYETKDFKEFTYKDYYVGLSTKETPRVWAPDFWIDKDGNINVILSNQDRPNEKDKGGHDIPSFSAYTMKVDPENGEASDLRKLNLEDTNKIDGHIFIHDGQYKLIIKDEYEKELELWTSDDAVNWTKEFESIPNTGDWIEGPFIMKLENGNYGVYFDKYAYSNEDIYYVETPDFKTFSERKRVSSDERLRHGSTITVYEEVIAELNKEEENPDTNVDDNNNDSKENPDTNVDNNVEENLDDNNGEENPDTNVDDNVKENLDNNSQDNNNGEENPDTNVDDNVEENLDNNSQDNNVEENPDTNVDTNVEENPNTNVDTNVEENPDTNVDNNNQDNSTSQTNDLNNVVDTSNQEESLDVQILSVDRVPETTTTPTQEQTAKLPATGTATSLLSLLGLSTLTGGLSLFKRKRK